MSQSKKAAKSVVVIIAFSLASKALGFIREMLIAAKFGSGLETDTFFIAVTAIGLFTSMITTSINTTMIPVLSEIEAVEGKTGKRDHTNNLLNIIILLSVASIIIAWILAPYILKLLATGFEGEQYTLAVLMMRIGLPAILFASVQGVFRGYLQSELLFTESAAAQFPFNLVYITFLLFLSGTFGIKGLMVTSVIAVASQITLQIPGIRSLGYRYNFKINLKDNYMKKIVYLIPPVLISATISDINNIVDKSMASVLVEGSISALQYASRLNSLIRGTFITAITTVIYPMLSKEANKDSYSSLKKVVIKGINVVLLITIPATVGMIVLSKPIVRVAFERGAFDSTATFMTIGALIFYALGLTGMAVKSLLNRVFYSLQDTKTPMINSFISLGINIALNLILIKYMAHRGLALATSISAVVTTLFLIVKLRNKIGSLGIMLSVKCLIKTLIAAIIMGVAVYLLNSILLKGIGASTLKEAMVLTISIGLGALIYSGLIYIFRIEEVEWILSVVREKIRGR